MGRPSRILSNAHHAGFAASSLLFGIGLTLFGLNFAGWLSEADRTADGVELRQYVSQVLAGGRFDLNEATNRVYKGTRHSDERRVDWTENWLQWLLGKCYSPLAHTQDTERLIAGGIANCSERAQILKTISEAAHCRCRFAGLSGHVVLEVYFKGRWRMADPDYGITFHTDVRKLQGNGWCVQGRLARRGYDAATIDRYLSILQSAEDNLLLPEGLPLSPRLDAVEHACRWLVWLLPLACCLVGLIVLQPRVRMAFDAFAWS